ncbi:SAM-dependent methyltransferase [Nonomuraea salmonea]|uniref:SAM-dependent methyltransferase n=1 Tax=Nonomuraea salmonea TaxID=46181 RepID=A0ABV5NMV6_9ACTN
MRPHQQSDDRQPTSAARMYDYFLGGTNNLQVDRDAAAEGLRYDPDLGKIAQANRQFLIRAVRHVAEQGVSQFLDVGSGLPTQENVHEVAQSINPGARTIYVDSDPSVLPQAEALLVGDEQTRFIKADVRDPHGILTHPDTLRHFDVDQPWGLVLCSVLHFVPDADDAYGVVFRLMEAMPPKSYMVFAHVSSTDIDPGIYKIMMAANAKSLSTPVTYRTVEEIARFFDQPGWSLLEPGLVDVQRWQPGHVTDDYTRLTARVLGGVAQKA